MGNTVSSHNKRIAKNTIMLYFRMIISLIVSLYTSRVVLNTLGVEDFGIYSVVGGVVMMFSFFSTTLSGATSRFLTFELGRENMEKLKKVFNSTLHIHIYIGILILIFAETVGLWFVEYKLVIPEDRMFAARVVYQFSIFTSILSIIRVPYNASIISHERMSIYAYISIIETVLKLIIVYALVVGHFDKLILYGILMFITTFLITLVYIYYCRYYFKECRFSFAVEKDVIRPILTYSAWDLYGNLSVMVRGQGINILQNLFFGPIINAASTIATQVQNVIAGFADNFLTAVRPQIVKNYAVGNVDKMLNLNYLACKSSFFLLFFMSLPLIIENKFVLTIWLKNVPDYAVIFCQLSLINNLISIMFRTIAFSIHATGRIKRISFINGTIYIMVLPISYIFLKFGGSPVLPFIVNIVLLILGCLSNLYTLRLYIPSFSVSVFLKRVVLLCLIIASLSSFIPIIIHLNMPDGWTRFIIVGASSVFCVSVTVFCIGLDKDQRSKVVLKLKEKIGKVNE